MYDFISESVRLLFRYTLDILKFRRILGHKGSLLEKACDISQVSFSSEFINLSEQNIARYAG